MESNVQDEIASPLAPSRGWGKFAVYGLAVVLPAVLIASSTYHALPESFWLILGMLLISCGIAAVFMYYSGDATPKIRRYCVLAALILGTVMALGLIVHVLLSRELSIAQQDVQESHKEKVIEDRRFRERQEINAQILEKQRQLARAEAIRNDSIKRAGGSLPAGRGGTVLTLPSPTSESQDEMVAASPITTPAQVRHRFSPWIVGAGIADVLASVIAVLILASIWEWDRDHDGIEDRKQRSRQVSGPKV